MECISSFEVRIRKEYTLYNFCMAFQEKTIQIFYIILIYFITGGLIFLKLSGEERKCHIEYSSDNSIKASLYHLQLRRQWPSQLRSISVGEVEYNSFSFQISKRLQDTSPYHTPIRFPVVITSLSTDQCIVLKFELNKLQPVQITPSCYK